jgi:hypothetical protein
MTNEKDPFAIRKRNLKVSEDNPFAVADERGNLPDAPPELDIADLFKGEMSEEDRASQMREHLANKVKKDNGHDLPPDLPPAQPTPSSTPSTQSNTPVPLSDREFKKSLSDTSPNVSEDFSLALVRAEEIEAEIVRKGGRYIPGVDDAKPGVPYTTKQDERVSMLDGQVFKVPLINSLNINSDGVTIRGGGIFDPGEGAQPQSNFQTNKSANPNDPRSENFLTCSNNQCQYREGCMRFRLKNRRPNSFPFFPESCRKDGIYLSINESDYTGYDNFDTLTRGASNVTRLPNP